MQEHERETYRLHARSALHRRRREDASAHVTRAMREVPGSWAAGVSGGKDSTALVALCLQAGWRGPLFHWRFEETPPENTLLVHGLGERFDLPVIDVEVPGDFTTFAEVGHFFAEPVTAAERAAVVRGERRYKAAVESAVNAAGIEGVFWGMRADESRVRQITLRTRGMLYRAAARRSWTCAPLAWWSARDVWATIVSNDMAYLDLYDTAENRERERSETTWLGFPDLWRRGMGRRLRERDPALWRRLCARFPGLEAYG